MTPTRKDLSDWFDIGIEIGALHMIVVDDTKSNVATAVYVMQGEDVSECVKRERNRSMQRVLEVYDLKERSNATHTHR